MWEWKENSCLLWYITNLSQITCCICKTGAGCLIPVSASNNGSEIPSDSMQMNTDPNLGGNPNIGTRNQYVHYMCYQAYKVSLKRTDYDKLEVSQTFIDFCTANQMTPCDDCQRLINVRQIVNSKYFIKHLETSPQSIRGNTGQNSYDQINTEWGPQGSNDPESATRGFKIPWIAECYDWVWEYMRNWMKSDYANNDLWFTIREDKVNDIDVADRREFFF